MRSDVRLRYAANIVQSRVHKGGRARWLLGAVILVASLCACQFNPSTERRARVDARAQPDASAPQVPLACDFRLSKLLMCLRFEESGQATLLEDESQYQHDITVLNASFVVGHTGLALQSFEGFESALASTASLNPSSEITMEMWLRPDMPVAGGRQGLIDNDGNYGLFLHKDEVLKCSTGGGPSVTSGPDVVVPGAWQHVACSYNGTTIKLFVDGIEVKSEEGTSGIGQDGTEGLRIAHNSPSGEHFVGRMDTLRIWNVGLSHKELCELADLSCPAIPR